MTVFLRTDATTHPAAVPCLIEPGGSTVLAGFVSYQRPMMWVLLERGKRSAGVKLFPSCTLPSHPLRLPFPGAAPFSTFAPRCPS